MLKKIMLLLGGLLPIVAGNVIAQNTADKRVLSITRNPNDNTPVLIQFAPGAGWKAGQEQELFTQYLGVDGGKTHMVQQYSTTTKSGVTTARYYEYYKGIRSEYGSFTVTSKDGGISFMSGNYYNTATDVSDVPALSESEAFDKAIQRVGAQKYMWENAGMEALIKRRYHKADTSYKPHGILRWVEDFSAGKGDRKMHLAYAFDIYADVPRSRQAVFVDAADGHILHVNSLIKHTAAVGHSLYSKAVPMQTANLGPNYVLFDSTRGNGVYTVNMNNGTDYSLATDIINTTTNWPALTTDSTAMDAQWGGEMVYDYWRTEQGRLSWDNMDGELVQYVHYDVNFDNAFWDGAEMSYGDGSGCGGGGFTSLTSLDVTGHEIGHGVCQATANLIYESESGAINEGLSDCWGATIENWANPHEVDAVAKQSFKMGEEIGCGTPLRSMDSPHNESNPDTYGTNDPYWFDVMGCTPGGGNDQCGVHTNSGVTNKWYYLLVTGGAGVNANGDTYAVSGIGWTKSANILYQTELALPSTSTYADFMMISIATASTIYGACSPEVQAVTNAWYAVGVGTPFVPCVPQFGFTTTIMSVTEYAGSAACPASHTVTIGVTPTGPVTSGGNPVVTITPAYGTALAGIDYTLGGTPITFPAGDMSTHYATMTIYDNGAINDTKNLVLYFTVNPMGTGATVAPGNDTLRITINNDDSTVLVGGPEYHTLNTGSLVTSNLTSAFVGSDRRDRSQFLLLASEMIAAGMRPGVPISQLAFNITSRSSTLPYLNYTVSMANTTANDLSTFVTTGFTTVYTGNHTTNLGLDSLDFSTNFTWDGTSNVAVNVCYGMNASAAAANDLMSGIDHGSLIVCDHNQTNSGSGTGCGLGYSMGGRGTARPVMRFKQLVRPSKIATVLGSNHTWSITTATTTNFINTSDTAVVATMANPTADLGCVNATLSASGAGFVPSVFSPANRSVKEVTITPTINGAITTYNVTIYLTNTELGAVAPASLFLMKTEQPTDATVTSANSVLLTPTLVTGTTYVGFKATFTGVNGSRFFLTDGLFCTPPTAVITPAGPTTFCTGGSVVLNASTGTGYTYQWQQGGTDIPGATNSGYTASVTGSYTVRISSFSCVSTSLGTAVTVNSVFAAPIGGATSVCTGQMIALSDATGGGVWSSGAPPVASVDAAGNVTGATPGVATISYVVTNACGTATATTTINVNASPVVSVITGAAGVCVAGVITLSDATPSGVWSSSNVAVATVGTAGQVSGATAGTANIIYSVTNGAGCTTSQNTTITVNALPSASISATGSTTICSAGSVPLSGPVGAGLTYQWQLGGVNISGATNANYTTSVAGVYGVRVTNSAGCTAVTSAGATITVIVDPTLVLLPVVTITASPGATFCATPTTTMFSASSVNGGSAPVYNWYINGVASGTGTTHTYLPSAGDVVVCVLTSNAACAAPLVVADTMHIAVAAYATPLVAISAVPNDTVCSGSTAIFVAVPTYGGTAPTYNWSRNGINVATGPTYSCIPLGGDVIVCRMVSNYTCRAVDVALSAPLTVTVEPNVPNSVTVTVDHMSLVVGSAATFTAFAANPGASPVFQWYINGTAVVGATSATFTTTTLVDGQVVSCSIASSNPCAYPATNYSAGISMHVSNGVGVIGQVNNLLLVPNPNNGTFIIAGTLVSGATEANVEVVDMLGQVVYSSAAPIANGVISKVFTLDNSVAAGMYLVHVTTTSGSAVFHMAVTK
jgi:Zn-dependent metalloprotease